MLRRLCALLVGIALAGSCGPEAAVEPLTGVYDIAVENLENSCDPRLDDRAEGPDATRFADGRLTIGYRGFLHLAVECPDCVAITSWGYPQMTRDPETGWFVRARGAPTDRGGCLHGSPALVAEVLDAETVRARITDEWTNTGGCAWLAERPGCTTVREYTYTLVEACDDCSLDELRDRAQALYAEQHPLPE